MDWVSRYKVVRRGLLLFISYLIWYATMRVFGEEVQATQEYIALLGLLGVATAFYMKWRKEEDANDNS